MRHSHHDISAHLLIDLVIANDHDPTLFIH